MVEIKLDTYALLERAVEEGVAYGYRRAYKHTDKPHQEAVIGEMIRSVMASLADTVVFNDDPDDDYWCERLAEVLLDAGGELPIHKAANRAKISEMAVVCCVTDEPECFYIEDNIVYLRKK